uniref:F-box domain-containing protein n=1 Tax=Globodera pallida TaxID=36090 RepID=A0A183BJ57_GLOPA
MLLPSSSSSSSPQNIDADAVLLRAVYSMNTIAHFDHTVRHDGILWDLRFENPDQPDAPIPGRPDAFGWRVAPRLGAATIAPEGTKCHRHKLWRWRRNNKGMYLITTLLPGHGQSHQNGNAQNGVHHHHHSQTNGHRRNNSPHMPSAALINHILPTELMLRVFSYLDITSLGRCAQVCRSWNKLAMDGSNWMDVDLFSFQREVKTTVVESLAKRCGSFLKVLSLKGCENVQDNAMRSFAAKCPNIEQLTLTKCKLVTDSTCEYIGRYCHRIVMIDLENCTLITDIALKFIGEGCKRLEELNLSWCEQISDIGIAYVAKSCPNLHTLFCKGLENLSSQCFGQLVMPELRALNLFSCPNVTDETVADVARNCHQLEFLSLSNCKEITDQAIVSISHGCPKLRDLELAGCANLTDSGFVQLAKNCHELERMDLEECLLITDSTLSNFNNGCPNLYSLSLSHCENLTDNGLADLCVAHRERLQVLELDNCPNITDLALESMKHLTVLERVDLYDCQMITKDAIKKFKQARPEVEVHAYFAPATPPPQPAPNQKFPPAATPSVTLVKQQRASATHASVRRVCSNKRTPTTTGGSSRRRDAATVCAHCAKAAMAGNGVGEQTRAQRDGSRRVSLYIMEENCPHLFRWEAKGLREEEQRTATIRVTLVSFPALFFHCSLSAQPAAVVCR